MNVRALQNRVSPETEDVFNDGFWEVIKIVCRRLALSGWLSPHFGLDVADFVMSCDTSGPRRDRECIGQCQRPAVCGRSLRLLPEASAGVGHAWHEV